MLEQNGAASDPLRDQRDAMTTFDGPPHRWVIEEDSLSTSRKTDVSPNPMLTMPHCNESDAVAFPAEATGAEGGLGGYPRHPNTYDSQ